MAFRTNNFHEIPKAEGFYPNTPILRYAGIPIRHLPNLKLYQTVELKTLTEPIESQAAPTFQSSHLGKICLVLT